MGRGLSDLQKWTLIKARANRAAESLDPIGFRVCFHDPADDMEPGSLEWRRAREFLKDLGCLATDSVWKVDDPVSEANLARMMGNGQKMSALFAALDESDPLDAPPWPIGAWSPIVGGCQMRGGYSLPDLESFSPSLISESEAESIVVALRSAGIRATVRTEPVESCDIYAWEPLAEFYGFAEHRKQLLGGPQCTHHPVSEYWGMDSGKRRVKGRFFDPKAIGVRRYEAAKVAVSKAFSRLQARGLALRFTWRGSGSGLKLTAEGMDEAESLSDNRSDIITQGSQ